MGRRLYIHAYSFRSLCLESECARPVIMECLVSVAIRKMIFNRVIQDGMGTIYHEPDEAQMIETLLGKLNMSTATAALQRISHARRLPGGGLSFFQLLGPDEEIEGTCFHDNYYTFATSTQAVEAMYRDMEPIAELRSRLQRPEPEPDIADIMLIRGDTLVWEPDVSQHGMVRRRRRHAQNSGQSNLLNREAANTIQTGREFLRSFFGEMAQVFGTQQTLAQVEADICEALDSAVAPVCGG